MFSEKTLYKIIDAGILKVRNIDLPRQVTYKKERNLQDTKLIQNAWMEEGTRTSRIL